MNTVNFFGHEISKLIIGDNPMTGHSYIQNVITGQEMIEYYTAEKIKEAMFHMEECGYTAMLPLAHPYIIRLIQEYQREGGKMKFIFQPYMPMNQDVSIREMMSVGAIGVYHQGTTTDYLYETGKTEEILKMIEKYREMGIPVGLGTHRPEVIELSEKCGCGESDFILVFFDFVKGVANAFLCVVDAVADAFTAVDASLGVNFGTAVAHSDCLCGAVLHAGCAACAFARVERYGMDVGIHHTILSSARNQ